jgi:hypothetical protein
MNLLGESESMATRKHMRMQMYIPVHTHMHVIMLHQRGAVVDKRTNHERATANTRVRVSSRENCKCLIWKNGSSGALACGAELIKDPRASNAVKDVDAA